MSLLERPVLVPGLSGDTATEGIVTTKMADSDGSTGPEVAAPDPREETDE